MKRYLLVGTALVIVAVLSAQMETLPDWVAGMQLSHPFLLNTFLKVHVWQWIGLGILLFVAVLAGIIVKFITVRLIRLRDHFASQPVAETTRSAIGKSAGIVSGAGVGALMLNDLSLRPAFQSDLTTLLNFVALFGAVSFVYAAWDVACDSLASRSAGHQRAERLLVPMTRKLVRVTIVICGLMCGIALFGGTRTIATLAGTLGIGGLVVALAGKDSVENLFGSFTILFDMPFALGDWVRIDKVEGAVEQINLRSTRIRTSEDTVILLPNANLIRASVENFGSRRFRRLRLNLRLSYDCHPEQIEAYMASLHQFLLDRPDIDDNQALVGLADPQLESIGLIIDCRMEVANYVEEVATRHQVIEEALRLRKEHGVVFAAAPRPADPEESADPAPQTPQPTSKTT